MTESTSLSFYSSTGRAPAKGIALGSLAGLFAGVLLAWAYSYLIVYLPIAGYVTFLIAGGFGAIVGGITGYGLRSGHVRNGWVGGAIGLVVALVVQYVAWAVWVHASLARADVPSDTLALLLSPSLLWDLVSEINRVGAWSIRGATPTGTVLWVLWSIELLLITGAATAISAAILVDPYCERCGAWTEPSKGLVSTADAPIDEVRSRIERRALAELAELGAATADAPSFLRFDVHSCASCNELHVLGVVQVVRKVEKDKVDESEKTLLANVLVGSREVEDLRSVARRLVGGVTADAELAAPTV